MSGQQAAQRSNCGVCTLPVAHVFLLDACRYWRFRIAAQSGTDGNLWFTEGGGSTPFGRMTPTGVVTHLRVPPSVRVGNPRVANGPNGSLVMTTSTVNGRNAVFRVSPSGALAVYRIPAAIRHAFGFYLGAADGSLWFSTPETGTFELGGIMPNGSAVAYNLSSFVPAETQALAYLAAGRDGNLYGLDVPDAPGGDIVYRIVPGELQPEQGTGTRRPRR
jgi:hypothetical protein